MRCSAEYVERRSRIGICEGMDMFLARNYVPRDVKGEIDLIGYDGETLVFVEERTAREDHSALSEVSVTAEKQHLVGRMARRFPMESHVKESRCASLWWRSKNFPAQRQWYVNTRMLLTRGCKNAHWKIRRNHRNAVI
jgi:Holliday junction resolvase-like predicted endonuclease